MKNSIYALGLAATIAACGTANAQPQLLGSVCGVPNWHHIGGQVIQFTVTKITQLPNSLTPSTMYAVPIGALAASERLGVPLSSMTLQSMPWGFIVAGDDVVIRQALGQPGCFDVLNIVWNGTDDGPAYMVVDHDAPSE